MPFHDERISDSFTADETQFLADSLYLAILTDEVVCGRRAGGAWIPELNASRLLELRVFNERGEGRLYRDHLKDDFYARLIDDESDPTREFYDETHYLDQDEHYTQPLENNQTQFRTTGGGYYTLPFAHAEDARRVRVRLYLAEGYNGLYYVSDWRVVGFVKEGD